MQGNLPYVSLLNALNGTVAITTNSFAATASISASTCPASFNVKAANNGTVSFSVNNSVTDCQFTITDPITDSSVVIQYSNQQ